MFQLIGYYESVDQGGALAAIAAMNDPTLFTSGDDVRIADPISYVQGAAFLSAATTVTAAQLQSPSLRTRNNLPLAPLTNADDFGTPPAIMWLGDSPIPLTPGEKLNYYTNTDNTGAVAIQGLVWLSDGRQVPVEGDIFSVSATSSITLSAGNWVNGTITLDQPIPNGQYELVGLRAVGTNLQAARVVFPGGSWRPGVHGANAVGDIDFDPFRFGRMGSWGTFDSDNLPSIDALGHTDTSQTYILDVRKIG